MLLAEVHYRHLIHVSVVVRDSNRGNLTPNPAHLRAKLLQYITCLFGWFISQRSDLTGITINGTEFVKRLVFICQMLHRLPKDGYLDKLQVYLCECCTAAPPTLQNKSPIE